MFNETDSGAVRVIDFMPERTEAAHVIRVVQRWYPSHLEPPDPIDGPALLETTEARSLEWSIAQRD
jgi:hypothetical protein